MKPLAYALALLLLLSAALNIAVSSPPSAMDIFRRQPTARVAWSAEVGRIRSTESQAIITALLVEQSGPPVRQMRGVRINVTKPSVNSADLYLEEENLPTFLRLLDFISIVTADLQKDHQTRSVLVWYDSEREPIFRNTITSSTRYCVGLDATGLSIAGFWFPEAGPPGSTCRRLARAITRVMEELKLH